MNYLLCEAPICVGSPTQGSEYAFEKLVEHGLADVFGGRAELARFQGARTAPSVLCDPRLHDLETVMLVNRALFATLTGAFKRGYFPITVGGDHSIAISTISALAHTVGAENTAVIYIDGHTDINTEQTTLTGFIHGMPLAAAMGLCTDKLTVGSQTVNLYGENTFIVGARSIDDPEYDIVEQQGVHLYTADTIRERGIDAVLDEILTKTADKRIHLCLDVDSMDGAEFPSTGYVMPDGLSFDTVYRMIERILQAGRVASFECVEYNPLLDTDGSDREKLFRLFRLFK